MPPNNRTPFSQEAQRLIELLAHYLDLFESYSDQVRCLPNGEELYSIANSNWTQDPFVTPLAGDAAQRTAFFARCDAIIDSTPVTIEEYVFSGEHRTIDAASTDIIFSGVSKSFTHVGRPLELLLIKICRSCTV